MVAAVNHLNKHLIFIYGSLRSGCERPMLMRFPTSTFVADAAVNGSLYDLGPYPGLLLNESSTVVVGEVYEVDDQTLDQLDVFEESSNYRRKQVVAAAGADRKLCWTYEPDPAFYSLSTLISSGDWIEYAGTKTDWPRE